MNQVTLLHQLLVALYGALQDIDILRQLSKLGYDAKMLKDGQKLGNQFGELVRQQEDAQRQAKTATRNLKTVRERLQETYMRHISQARIIFKDKPEYLDELGLKGTRERTLEKWLKQCQDFYYYVSNHTELMEKYNIPATEIAEMQTVLAEVTSLYALQKQAHGRAQVLTQQKKEMAAVVKQWYSKFIKVARLALDEQPQQLEVLGVVVKA